MIYIDMFVFIYALLLGSFLNVAAIRLLKKESVSFPPSHCPTCKNKLNVFDLVPVFSYLFLRGKCRYCKQRISALYPFGELLTAFTIFLVYKEIGWTLELIPALLLTVLLLLSVLTDIREKLILDIITFPMLGLLVLIRYFIGTEPFMHYLLGGVVGFSLLLIIAIVSKGGMGGGDIKLYAAIGVGLGPLLTIMSLVLASFAGAIAGVFLLLTGKVKRQEPIPFAPFIFIGTILSFLYGNEIFQWYISFY
ncbi:prepilin peptidase [Cytobacillus sp. NCCP-133]|uniref:prepilin peptidase n=1 Tax=Cytobacillus sp. NCCP-133 TaxID=766848 RepID=UPI00223201C3|nr:A24 family peptidase [Cytobacillus sp. NCCP-133]GLB58382.1 type 4 prepilin-like proteins leader peptide-processing enzyme [Cytobacillus sp. NCCP-133]